MPRFRYNANCVALGGRITRPFECEIPSQASCVLSSAGGRASASSPAYKLVDPATERLILAYDSAESIITGNEGQHGQFSTNIRCSIKKFNVQDVLKADEVIFQLTVNYDHPGRKASLDTAGTHFVNLTINGEPFPVDIDHAMSREASDYEQFVKNHPNLPRSQGRVHYSLGRNPHLKFEGDQSGYYHVPDFGTIYFAEWTAAPDTQSVNMFRLELGSPVGGSIGAGGGAGNGGPV